ncbi:hypothetical protein RPD_0028 [Rhodopseudomonas palustris BisB5]|uniref:TniQ domain-containing protein n=1 Tax=Rhodopseudomonas palustris (strain BisB5) TaxID=316057 RepID=Q13F71_RHOPS|nr:hypothetical protein RPD_0028 [Rhodopseudomonas palustris BisB5]
MNVINRSTAVRRPLACRGPLWTDEPAYARANRLALMNGINSLASFGGEMRIPYRQIIWGWRNAEIAALAGMDPANLGAVTFRVGDDDRVRLGDEVLHIDDWSYNVLRVCPACLRSDFERESRFPDLLPHIRSWWNLDAIEVCPLHRTPLLGGNPDIFGHRNDPKILDVRFVAGVDCDLSSLQVEVGIVEDVRAESYILGRLGFMPRVRSEILDDLPLWNAIRLMDRFGAVAAAGVRGFTSLGGSVSKREALSAGYAVFADGKDGLFCLLDRLVADADVARGKWGPRVAYGRIYEWLSHDTREEAYDPVRELVRQHAIDNIPMAAGDLVFDRPIGDRHVFTLWHVSRELKTTPSATRRILKAMGHLSPDDDVKENWQVLLRKPVVDQVTADLADWLGFNEARALLGLPRAPMDALLQSGVLKAFLSVSTGVAEHIFRRRDLDAFMTSLVGGAPFSRKTEGLCDVVQAGRRSGTSTTDVVAALLAGRLTCCGRLSSATGMMQVLVDIEAVRALRASGEVRRPGMTVEDARRKLGVTWPVVSNLIGLGLIKTIETRAGPKNRKQSFIEDSELEAFTAEFVSATEIAEARKTHVRVLVPALRKQGIEPAIEKTAVGQYFYTREKFTLSRAVVESEH